MNETVRKDTREQVISSFSFLPREDTAKRCVFVCVCVCVCEHTHALGCVQLFATSWTATCQAPQSTGFSRQEYWSGLPFPSPGDLPNPGLNPSLLLWEVDSLPLCHLGKDGHL